MQKPWRDYDAYEFEPIDLRSLSGVTQDYLNSYTIEFIALGFDHVGDFRLHTGWQMQTVRFFQSVDGAVLGWVSDHAGKRSFSLTSILSDGTLVQSTPRRSIAPWSCNRFPVHVIFGNECGLEDLMFLHLDSLGELEPGCGNVIKYDASQLREIVLYMQMLVHETLHGRGAPPTLIPVPQAGAPREVSIH